MKLILSLGAATIGGLTAMLLTAPAALAIDCAKASSSVEKAICANPKAQQADDDMVAAFSNLKQSLKPADQKVLVANQASWIKSREDCTTDASGNAQADDKIAACVVAQTEARQKYLSGQPAEGPGTADAIVPVLRQGADGSFFTSVNFSDAATMAEKLVNNTLNGQMKKFHLAAKGEDYGDGFSATLAYASPALVSIAVVTDDESPKLAHPMRGGYSLNVDMQSGRELKIDDLLDKEGIAAVQQQCLGQLKDYFADTDGVVEGDQSPDLVKQDIASLKTWTFGAAAATLTFDPADSPPTGVCTIDYATLRPLAKASFPLPK